MTRRSPIHDRPHRRRGCYDRDRRLDAGKRCVDRKLQRCNVDREEPRSLPHGDSPAQRVASRRHCHQRAPVRLLRLSRRRRHLPCEPHHRQRLRVQPGSRHAVGRAEGRPPPRPAFVAGGPGGDGRVVNAITGEIIASYTFATAPTFVNDVVLTPDAAWFTDTQRAFLYKVPFGRFGRLPSQSEVEEIPFARRALAATGSPARPDGDALLVIAIRPALPVRSGDGHCDASRPRRHAADQRRRAASLRPHAVRRAEPAQPSRRRGAELGRDVRRGSPSSLPIPASTSRRPSPRSATGSTCRTPASGQRRSPDSDLQRNRNPEALVER